jgi:hypothetical protein
MSDEEMDDAAVGEDVSQAPAPTGRRRRFLAVIAASLVGLVVFAGWWARSAVRQREAVATIQSCGGKIKYADQLPFQSPLMPARWLMQWFGRDWGSSVVQVNLSGASLDDAQCAALGNLPDLRFLWLNGASIDDQSASHLEDLTGLEELFLSNTALTDEGVKHLAGLKRLRFLSLAGTKISDKGLQRLAGLTRLEALDLPLTDVTAAGVGELQKSLPRTKIGYSAPGQGLHASSTGSDGKQRDDSVGTRH